VQGDNLVVADAIHIAAAQFDFAVCWLNVAFQRVQNTAMRPATDELNRDLIIGSNDIRDLVRAFGESGTPIEEALLKAFLPPASMASLSVQRFAVLRDEHARFIEPIRVSLMGIVQAIDGAYKGGCIMSNHRLVILSVVTLVIVQCLLAPPENRL